MTESHAARPEAPPSRVSSGVSRPMFEFLNYIVEDVMTRNPVTVRPDTTLREAEAIFEKSDFNGLPVVEESGELIGLMTKLDILRAFRFDSDHMFPPYPQIMKGTVERVMTRDVLTVWPRTPLARVLEKLADSGVKSFPVLDGDELVGIVSREDVLRGLRRAAPARSDRE